MRPIKDTISKHVVDELFHHYIHVGFGSRGKSTALDMLLPLLKIFMFLNFLFLLVESIKLLLVEQCHSPETWPDEEEIELSVILLILRFSKLNLGCFLLLVYFQWILLQWSLQLILLSFLIFCNLFLPELMKINMHNYGFGWFYFHIVENITWKLAVVWDAQFIIFVGFLHWL